MTERSYDEITRRVAEVREKIASAAQRSGRSVDEITLLGVTKTQSAEAVRVLLEAGVTEIGENRVQELLEKAPALQDIPHKSHLIGHLQKNKAKYLPGQVVMVQSVDSVELAKALEKAFGAAGLTLDVLIEVNIGNEANKSGVSPQVMEDVAKYVCA
jgi:pyridoxal phosphate enzyme (YggS family)